MKRRTRFSVKGRIGDNISIHVVGEDLRHPERMSIDTSYDENTAEESVPTATLLTFYHVAAAAALLLKYRFWFWPLPGSLNPEYKRLQLAYHSSPKPRALDLVQGYSISMDIQDMEVKTSISADGEWSYHLIPKSPPAIIERAFEMETAATGHISLPDIGVIGNNVDIFTSFLIDRY